jgi:predicted  nucleic acid-binding Zn-ribbon protein
MPEHKCYQVQDIKELKQEAVSLKITTTQLMDLVKNISDNQTEIKSDIKEIKDYITEQIPKLYASKTSLDRVWVIIRSII